MFDLQFYTNIDKWYKICSFRTNILNRQYEHDLVKDGKGIKSFDQFAMNQLHNVSGIEMSNYCCMHQFYFENAKKDLV